MFSGDGFIVDLPGTQALKKYGSKSMAIFESFKASV